MSGYHAPIAPSSLALTIECTAWIGLTLKMPRELLELMTKDTEETLEGNAADWMAKEYARGNEVPYGSPIPMPGDFKADHDMIHGAKLWRDTVGYGAVNADVPVMIERIHAQCWGTPDNWRWDAIEGVLRVWDYKYGFRLVEVFECWQLIAYAVGLIDTLGLNDQEIWVDMTVVQPRAFHKDGPVRSWKVRGDALRAYANIAASKAREALPPSPDLAGKYEGYTAVATTGPHCDDCPARLACAAYHANITRALSFSAKPDMVALDADALGAQLLLVMEAVDRLKGAQTALEAQAEAYLRAGKRVPNFHMEPGQSHLKWNDDVTAEELLALGSHLKIDMRKPMPALNGRNSPIVTPTQAKKAGLPDDVVKQYASRPPGAMRLARTSTTEARRAFGAIST